MTLTIDTLVYDREFSTEDTSSVIDHVYYSTDQKVLVVQLFQPDYYGDAVLAAYSDVPEDVFRALELENTNRLNGNAASSVGRYWNLWIKPYFTGLDTADLELLSAEEKAQDDARQEKLRKLVEETNGFFRETGKVAPAVDNNNTSEFMVHFASEEDGEDDDASVISVYAVDESEALVIFNKIADLAGWDDVQVVAVTHFFN